MSRGWIIVRDYSYEEARRFIPTRRRDTWIGAGSHEMVEVSEHIVSFRLLDTDDNVLYDGITNSEKGAVNALNEMSETFGTEAVSVEVREGDKWRRVLRI